LSQKNPVPHQIDRSSAGYLPTYFSSEWSFAQFRVRNATTYSVAFDQQHPNTITIVGIDKRCVEELVSLSTLHYLHSSL
jgi:hypothetical protein